MKKRILMVLLCLVLLVTTVSAAELPRIVDEAGLLTPGEEASLEARAAQLREDYGMDVVIVTVWSLNGRSPRDYADDYYDYNGYGCGSDHSGMLFLLALESRDWYISTCGRAIEVLTDYGIQRSADGVVPYLSAGKYAEGFGAWLDILPGFFESWQAGTPIDLPKVERGVDWVLSVLMSLLFGGVGILVMLAMHRTKKPQAGAGSYLDSGSFRLRSQRDLFLGSHVSKTRRSQNTGGGRGGSSTHRSSSGRRHGGGGGKF